MFDLYLITRLGVLSFISVFTTVIFGLASIVLFISSQVAEDDIYYREEESIKRTLELRKQYAKYFKKCFAVFLVSLIITIIVPSKRECYLIYGGGTIIEYLKDNPKVKEIPDNAIDALNNWLNETNPSSNEVSE